MPLIIGVTSGGVLVPVRVDANGVVIVDQVSALPAGNNNIGNVDVVTLPALPAGTNEIGKIQARNYGLVGGSFQKDPIRLGYSGDKTAEISDLTASAGTNIMQSEAVPAGEIWVVEAASIRDNTSVPGRTLIYAYINSINIFLAVNDTPAAAVWDTWSGAITLSEGDRMKGQLTGCTLNDDIYFNYHARVIDVDQ